MIVEGNERLHSIEQSDNLISVAMIEKARRNGKQYLNPVPTSVGTWSTFLKVLWLFLTNREERTPKQALGPFRTDPQVYETPPASGLRVTWMGHSTTLLEIDGVRVLVDPVWEQRTAPVEWFGPKRFFAPPLRLEDLPRIDVVLLSHDHYDHLGARTVRRLAQIEALATAQWVTALGVGKILNKLGVKDVRELDWTESLHVGQLELTALPARHFSGRSLSSRFETLWTSFVLAGPKHRIYYGADSGEWEGFREIGQAYGPIRSDHAGDRRVPSLVGGYSHGPGRSGENVSRHGRHRHDDAYSLGTVQSCSTRLAAAHRARVWCGWPEDLGSGAGGADGGNPGSPITVGMVAAIDSPAAEVEGSLLPSSACSVAEPS